LRAGVRRFALAGVAIALVIPFTPSNAFGDALSSAQARITAAQQAADHAGQAYDAATAKYYQLEDDATLTRTRVDAAKAVQADLLGVVQQRAAQLYMRVGSSGFEVFGDTTDVLDASRRATLAAAANAGDDIAISKLRAATEDLRAREASLTSELAGAKVALSDLKSQQDALQGAVNEAMQAEQQLRAQLAAAQRSDEYNSIVRHANDAARSSTGNSSTAESPDPPQIIASGDWVCPVQGGSSFTDTFGAPRGNGRTHKGVDMFAPVGTPLVAVVSGSVFFQSDPLGGLAAYVTGGDGTTYYYAHLNDYVGGGRSVQAGELIGHVGNTGDASDAPPQLHFEIRPGGPNGIAIDPYPTVAAHC
jgi:murein DD-endopeptidase MepM/ murein hydrolase activator NlpD